MAAKKPPAGRCLPCSRMRSSSPRIAISSMTANMQTDYADERHGLGFLLQDEYPHIVQPQFGGQHRTGRPAPGNDHVEHEGRAIGAGGRRRESGDVAHGGVALDRVVRRRLGGELQRVHRCCLSGVPCWRGAPGDTYVNRPTVTGRGSTHIDTAFMGLTSSGGVTVNCKLQARASSRPILSQPRDHDSKRARAAATFMDEPRLHEHAQHIGRRVQVAEPRPQVRRGLVQVPRPWHARSRGRPGFEDGTLGGAEGTRTPNPCLAKAVLCQLSYGPAAASRRRSD